MLNLAKKMRESRAKVHDPGGERTSVDEVGFVTVRQTIRLWKHWRGGRDALVHRSMDRWMDGWIQNAVGGHGTQ